MINQLNAFRDECYAEQLKNGKDLLNKYQTELEKMENQIGLWKDDLQASEIDQAKVDQVVQETKSSLVELKKKPFEVKEKLLKGKGFYFHSNNLMFTSKDFGELLFDEFKTIDLFETYQCAAFPFESKILSFPQSIELLKLCEFPPYSKFTLLYRASRDGFAAEDFHSRCDRIIKTLTIIKVKDEEFTFMPHQVPAM